MADLDEVARYSFLPWMRTGIATGIDAPDNLGLGSGTRPRRAEIPVDVSVTAAETTRTISKRLAVVGSGDITGLDARAMVRTEPPHNTMDFEPNYFVFFECYDETLLWCYTPAGANAAERLRPWLALLVLADGEYEEQSVPDAPLPAIAVAEPGRLLPPPEELWGWAHVQANEDLAAEASDAGIGVEERLDQLLEQNPDMASSRILSPRRLRPNTGYQAFLVPSLEVGRLAGLGQEVAPDADGLAPAWAADPVLLPVYYRWRFRTGERGDFEEMVRRLQARIVPTEVGIRPAAVDAPGFGLPPVTPPALGLEGALRAPGAESTPWPDREPFVGRLIEVIDLSADLEDPEHGSDATVSLPLYGRWHAKTSRVGDTDAPLWLRELNLDPRPRAIAGFGTLVVQHFQDRYLDAAWEQIGDVLAANRLIARTRLAMLAAKRIYARIASVPLSALISFTAPVHRRILGSPTTLQWQMQQSVTPRSLVDPAFRRAIRPGGPLRRRAAPAAALNYDRIIERVSAEELVVVPPKRAGEGQQGFERDIDGLLEGFSFRRWLWEHRKTVSIVLFIIAALVFAGLAVSGMSALGIAVAAAIGAAGLATAFIPAPVAELALEDLRDSNLAPDELREISPRPDFRISDPGTTPPSPGEGATDSAEAARFRQALVGMHSMLAATPADLERAPLEIESMSATLLAKLQPSVTQSLRLNARIRAKLPPGTIIPTPPGDRPDADTFAPIMAAPNFDYPMYKELENISAELLIPNLEKVPTNTVTLLEENRPFIEAYMVGLNHEMVRELRMHEYPTDLQGMIFSQFWDPTDSASDDPESARDVSPIHTWLRESPLGSHPVGAGATEPRRRLVLLVRGDLLRRYPNTLITAAPAVWPEDATATSDREPDYDAEIEPLFTAQVGSDINFFGFELTAEEARGSTNPDDEDPGWFFVIRERPGDPRFGLDVAHQAATTVATQIEDLSWGHVGAPEDFDTLENVRLADGLHHVSISAADNPQGVAWNTHSGELAHMLYQTPVVVAVHAHRMLGGPPA